MPILKAREDAQTRSVVCTNCERVSEVASRAMSVFCPHCKKRLILEDYKIKGYYAVTDFATCGDIVVERRGFVVGPVKVENLTIKGKLQGQVTARGKLCQRGPQRNLKVTVLVYFKAIPGVRQMCVTGQPCLGDL